MSITVTFTKGEKKDIKPCLEHFESTLKSISLLPLADSDHQYVQAPYIKITKEDYERISSGITTLNLADENTHDVNAEDKFCDGDSCTI